MNTLLEKTMQAGKAAVLVMSLTVLLVGALGASGAEAKKQRFNVVRCVAGQTCEGTGGRDRLLGTDGSDEIEGKGGKDVYRGNGDGGDPDFLTDTGAASSDIYTGYEPGFVGFEEDFVIDFGGPEDFLDLSSLKLFDDVTFIRSNVATFPGAPPADELRLEGPGGFEVLIIDHFGRGRIETVRFANGTVTGTQAASLAREATPKEQAGLRERLPDDLQPR